MGIPDKALVQVGRFPQGANNVAPLTDPPRDADTGVITAARSLLNVDIDNAGRARLRRGQDVIDASPAHSLFATEHYLFAVVALELRAYRRAGAAIEPDTTLVTGLVDRFVTYATDDFDVYASNGIDRWRIASDLTVHPFWLDTPAPVQAVASAAGGLAAGNYEVSVTVVDAEGRESGASAPVIVTLTDGQGIAVTLPDPPDDAQRWRVYRTTPNGEVLYLCADLPVLASAIDLGETTLGKDLQTAWLFPLEPCTTLRYGHGRLLGFAGDALIWSEALRLGLMRDTSHIGLRGGTLLEPLGEGGDAAGWYVADAKRTYYMQGADPASWRQRIVYPHAAVPNTSCVLPGSALGLDSAEPVVVWLSANGRWMLGLPGGQVSPLRANEFVLPVNAERGAAAFLEHNGIAQIVASLLGGEANPMNAAASDAASATIRRHGIEIE